MVKLAESPLLGPLDLLAAEAVVTEGYSDVASVDAPQSGDPGRGGEGEKTWGRTQGN